MFYFPVSPLRRGCRCWCSLEPPSRGTFPCNAVSSVAAQERVFQGIIFKKEISSTCLQVWWLLSLWPLGSSLCSLILCPLSCRHFDKAGVGGSPFTPEVEPIGRELAGQSPSISVRQLSKVSLMGLSQGYILGSRGWCSFSHPHGPHCRVWHRNTPTALWD